MYTLFFIRKLVMLIVLDFLKVLAILVLLSYRRLPYKKSVYINSMNSRISDLLVFTAPFYVTLFDSLFTDKQRGTT